MARNLDEPTKEAVRRRAEHRCEYCRILQRFYPDFAFHVEHITAKQHGGADSLDNLALACHWCNRKKGPNLSAVDTETKTVVPLFHPRKDDWQRHFSLEPTGYILGLSPTGRATVALLQMNTEVRVQIRRGMLE